MEFSFWGLPLSSSSSFLEYSDYVSGLKFVFELLCRIMEIQKKKTGIFCIWSCFPGVYVLKSEYLLFESNLS